MLSQISFFLSQAIGFHDLRLLYTTSGSVSIDALKGHMESWRNPSVLLVSGYKPCPPKNQHATSAKSVEKVPLIYGAFSRESWDGTHDKDFGFHHSLLFQLSPIHEVFLSQKQTSQHASFPATGGLLFGGTQGVRLSLDETLTEGVFTHEVSDKGTYENSFGVRRDLQWEETFLISAVEMIGFNSVEPLGFGLGGTWAFYS